MKKIDYMPHGSYFGCMEKQESETNMESRNGYRKWKQPLPIHVYMHFYLAQSLAS